MFQNPLNHGGAPGGTRGHGNASGQSTAASAAASNPLDIALYTDRLRSELVRQLDQRDRVEGELRKIGKEKTFLDDQLHDTISSYTTVIQNLQDQVLFCLLLRKPGCIHSRKCRGQCLCRSRFL